MIWKLHRDGRAVVAFACAIALALVFAMPTNAAPKCDIKGTDKGDTLVGTAKSEVICGFGGNDVIYGRGGNDTLRGGPGNDRLSGGTGDDKLVGGEGSDRLAGKSGNDTLRGGSGDDRLYGGTGDDDLLGGKGADRLSGMRGEDTLRGGPGNDSIVGGPGADDVRGDEGNDRLAGGTGDDRLDGGAGNDTLDGEAGDDVAIGGPGDDTVRGDVGRDELTGGSGRDRLYGDAGADRLSGGDGNDYLEGGRDGDRLLGGTGDDDLRGGTGNDDLSGGSGDDDLQGGDGNDTLSGDAGDDIIRGSAGQDVLRGGTQRDRLYGGTGADRLVGGAGRDELYGLAGNDRLVSDDGMKDILRGGSGRDGCNEDRKDDIRGVEYRIGRGSSDHDRDLFGSGGSTTIIVPDEPSVDGIVSAITRAPLAADGNVAGAPTDIVIDLDRSLDPAVAGRTLAAGRTIRVTLPDAFDTGGLPLSGPVACAAADVCNTGILLGVPSTVPGAPDQATYAVELEGDRTIVFTALEDLGPDELPGIKQIHLSLPALTNPQAGRYTVEIESETGLDGAVETGSAMLTVYPSIRPSINATSVFAAGEDQPPPEVAYQRTSTSAAAPLPWEFLLWEPGGVPAVGVELSQRDRRGGDILQDGSVIGSFTIEAPAGALGQSVSGDPSVLSDIPGTSDKAGRLTATFTAGDTPGLYVTTFVLDGGNSQQMQVEVA
jgi:Ca2+-binding RTX toxin-like protein